jgi:hypothetical protein
MPAHHGVSRNGATMSVPDWPKSGQIFVYIALYAAEPLSFAQRRMSDAIRLVIRAGYLIPGPGCDQNNNKGRAAFRACRNGGTINGLS